MPSGAAHKTTHSLGLPCSKHACEEAHHLAARLPAQLCATQNSSCKAVHEMLREVLCSSPNHGQCACSDGICHSSLSLCSRRTVLHELILCKAACIALTQCCQGAKIGGQQDCSNGIAAAATASGECTGSPSLNVAAWVGSKRPVALLQCCRANRLNIRHVARKPY